MKIAKLSTILVVAVIFGCYGLCKAEPVGTVFTYEGWLTDANGPADGLYDFLFTLYDDPDPNLGTQIGYINEANDVYVIEGRYAVDLDLCFGDPNVFNGEARWLEIAFFVFEHHVHCINCSYDYLLRSCPVTGPVHCSGY